MELEWVFFSVTPTAVSTSRMALLFTSSSLARSLIRTLLIRPFLPRVVLRSSSQPHAVGLYSSHAIENRILRAIMIRYFPGPRLGPAHAYDPLLRKPVPF